MLTKNDVLEWMREDLKEMEKDVEKVDIEIKKHLSKFKDLDKFFIDVQYIVNYYFYNQSEYKNIEDFKEHLKKEIRFYVYSFWLSFEKILKIDDELDNIINSYDKLIYFWEDNPVENLRKEEQSEWLMWSIKKSIWKVL